MNTSSVHCVPRSPTTSARSRRSAPARRHSRDGCAAGGRACAAACGQPKSRPRSSTAAAFPGPARSRAPRAASRPSKACPGEGGGRAEIPILFANDRKALFRSSSGLHRLLARPRRFEIRPVAPSLRYASTSRNTWRRSSPQQLRCRLNRQPQHLEPCKLSIAHQPNRHPNTPDNPRAVSSLIGTRVTF